MAENNPADDAAGGDGSAENDGGKSIENFLVFQGNFEHSPPPKLKIFSAKKFFAEMSAFWTIIANG